VVGFPGFVPGSTKTYRNRAYGISLEYPKGWKKKEGTKEVVAMFLAPKGAGAGMFQPNFNITVQDLTGTETGLDEYVESMTEKEKEIIPAYRLERVEAAELSGHPARRIVFTSKQGYVNLKVVQLCTLVGERAYAVTFAAEESRFAELWPAAAGMIDSFTIS